MSALPGSTFSPSEQLEEITRREAQFRLKVAQDFLVLQAELKAHRKRIDELSDELGRRNSYIHELHGQRHQWQQQMEERHGDIGAFMQRLAAAEDEARGLREQVARMRQSWGWSWLAPFRQLQKRLQPKAANGPEDVAAAPLAPFTYHLTPSPFRLHREGSFTLRGWAFPADGREITAIRVRVGGQEFLGRHGIEEPEVAERHQLTARNQRPGFEVTFATPAGRHLFSLEAQLERREWVAILRTPLWSEPTTDHP